MEDYINQKLAEAAKKTKKAQLEAQQSAQAPIPEKKVSQRARHSDLDAL